MFVINVNELFGRFKRLNKKETELEAAAIREANLKDLLSTLARTARENRDRFECIKYEYFDFVAFCSEVLDHFFRTCGSRGMNTLYVDAAALARLRKMQQRANETKEDVNAGGIGLAERERVENESTDM